jgi:hypothetical protein
MVKRGQHDKSPGDRRKAFSAEGGPAGYQARTHDVDRERATRPTGPADTDDEFADNVAPLDVPGAPTHQPGHADESINAAEIKNLHDLDLGSDELAQLQVLTPGTRLDRGRSWGFEYVGGRRVEFESLGGRLAGSATRPWRECKAGSLGPGGRHQGGAGSSAGANSSSTAPSSSTRRTARWG